MSSKRVKLGILNSMIILGISFWMVTSTSYYILAILLLICFGISIDVTGTLMDEQKRLKILRG